MRRAGQNGGRGNDPGQLRIEWSTVTGERPVTATPPPTISGSQTNVSVDYPAVQPLVQRLPWNFETTFPEALPRAIEAGILADEEIDTIRWFHLDHAKEALAVLHELDAVLDARRRGVNPVTGKTPRTPATRERLRKFFETEPGRLEHWYQTLMDTYAQAFGDNAADAFDKALRARHAGISVTAERDRPPISQPAETAEEPPVQSHVQKLARTERRRAVPGSRSLLHWLPPSPPVVLVTKRTADRYDRARTRSARLPGAMPKSSSTSSIRLPTRPAPVSPARRIACGVRSMKPSPPTPKTSASTPLTSLTHTSDARPDSIPASDASDDFSVVTLGFPSFPSGSARHAAFMDGNV
jgi:hypothetical protein